MTLTEFLLARIAEDEDEKRGAMDLIERLAKDRPEAVTSAHP